MPVAFNLVTNDETLEQSLIVMLDGSPEPVPASHEHFETIRDLLVDGWYDPEHAPDEDEIKALVFERKAIPAALERLSERVTLRDGNLFFDRDAIDTALSRHILRLAKEGDKGLNGFVKFMENLALNPSKLSRVHLFKWIEGRDFTITDDGMIVAYKAVEKREDGTLVSITSGSNTVFVNDEPVTGKVPNPIGAVVEISRSEVDPNREAACSYGLHVGTWSYAQSFGGYRGVMLKVIVNPRDVVAVPSDSASQKMRVSRYVIEDTIGEEIKEAILFSDNPDEVSDEFEEPFEDEFDDDSFLEPDTTFEPTDPDEEEEDDEEDEEEDATLPEEEEDETLKEDDLEESQRSGERVIQEEEKKPETSKPWYKNLF